MKEPTVEESLKQPKHITVTKINIEKIDIQNIQMVRLILFQYIFLKNFYTLLIYAH